MALPIYNREQGKLLPKDKSGSSSLPGGLAPNPKGGLPVFVRPETAPAVEPELPLPEPVTLPSKSLSSVVKDIPIVQGLGIKDETIDTFGQKLGIGDRQIGILDTIINNPFSRTKRSVERTASLSILDSLRAKASQLVGVTEKIFDREVRQDFAKLYEDIGFPEDKNPYKQKPIIDKIAGFDVYGLVSGKAKELKNKLDTSGSQYIQEELAKDPFSKTFAGQTTQTVAGMLPDVALAFLRTPTTILSLSEAGMNAEDSYKENVAKGMSKEEARSIAVKQLGADLFGTYITNKLGSLGSIEKAISGEAKKGITRGVFNYLKDAGLEVAQEVYQNILQNIATDKPYTSGISDTAKLSIIPAMLFGLAGPIANIATRDEMTDVEKAVVANEVATAIRDKQMQEGQGNPEIVADAELNEMVDIAQANAEAKIAQAGTTYEQVVKDLGVTPQERPQVPAPEVPISTEPVVEVTPIEQTPDQEKISSRVFERLQQENPGVLEGDLEATKVNLKKDADKAVELVEKDKQLAYDIAMGKEVSSDVTSTAVNIALAEKALRDGNTQLFAKLTKARSLAQTRRGQEIVAEKGSVNDNSVSKYVKELIALKLEKLGTGYLSDLKDRAKTLSLKGKSKKQRGVDVLNEKVGQVEKKIKTKKLDAKTAIKLLEELKCI